MVTHLFASLLERPIDPVLLGFRNFLSETIFNLYFSLLYPNLLSDPNVESCNNIKALFYEVKETSSEKF